MIDRGRAQPPVLKEANSRIVSFDTLQGRSAADLLFTDGWERCTAWDEGRVSAKVRSALIHGPVSAAGQELILKDIDLLECVVAAIWEKATTQKPNAFRSWLTNVREHSYLPLICGTRLTGDAREKAASQAERSFCALMWMAYEQMARCYGAVMFHVYIDFGLHNKEKPTLEEMWLFRQWHFPQLHLAGLPVDFLSKPQLRWVIRASKNLWNNTVLECDRYDMITELLGIFGHLVRERRDADRRQKAEQGNRNPRSLQGDEVTVGFREPEDEEGVRPLSSTNCPDCGSDLRVSSDNSFNDLANRSKAKVRLYCGRCNKDRTYVINLDELAPSG
jgi:hypothetical protein